MPTNICKAWKSISLAGALAGLIALPGIGHAQTIAGQASAVTAVVFGQVTSLANTGTLTSASEPLGTGQATGSLPGLLGAEALHAVTMGWSDQVYSESSLANLGLTVAGVGITASTVLSRALATAGGSIGQGRVEGLTIGGVPVTVTGAPNQAISLLGLSVILNEQTQSAGGIVVNALRVRSVNGLTDVAVGSSRAGI